MRTCDPACQRICAASAAYRICADCKLWFHACMAGDHSWCDHKQPFLHDAYQYRNSAVFVCCVIPADSLPVEFDASRRAMVQLREQGILGDQELHYTRKVLTAAANSTGSVISWNNTANENSSSTHVCGKCSSCDSAAASNRFTVWRKKS